MTSIVPYSSDVPSNVVEAPFRPQRPERQTLRQLAGLLLTRAWLGLAVAAVLFLGVVLVVSQMAPTYYAQASVLIQPKRANLAQAEQNQNVLPPETSAIDTEIEVLRSHAVAEAVVRKLQLHRDPEFNSTLTRGMFGGGRRASTGEPSPQMMTYVTNNLQRHMNIRRVGLTYVAHVGVTSLSPEKAQRIANTYVDAYLERQLASKISAVDRANRELGASVEKLRKEAFDAQAALQQYKIANNLMSAEGATMAELEVSTLNQHLAVVKAERAEKVARLNEAQAQVSRGGGGADVGAALNSDTIRELRKQEAETSVKLAQLESRFLPEYPEVKRTRAELNEVRGHIQNEIGRILSNLRSEAQVASQREASLLGSRGQAQGGLAANNAAMVGLVALEQRADAATKIYEGYLTRANEVAVEGSLQQPDATVNAFATIPTAPSSPNMRLAMAMGALLGLIGGAMAMLLAELWDRRLRSRGDVERELGIRFAGMLPDFASVARARVRGPAGPADHLVSHPFTGFAESFRNLRAFLMISARTSPAKVIAITSAVPKEGKSLSSLCLARTLAMGGAKVVLVDCDLRQRGVTRLIGGAELGIVEVVQDKVALDQALMRDPQSDCWVLPATDNKQIPHDLFSNPDTDELMKTLAERFDYVILDSPPILGVADARIIAAKADRVLYVVHWNKTPIRAAQSAVEILRECRANVAGALLSRVNVKQQAKYGYSDSSDYYQYFRGYYIAAA